MYRSHARCLDGSSLEAHTSGQQANKLAYQTTEHRLPHKSVSFPVIPCAPLRSLIGGLKHYLRLEVQLQVRGILAECLRS